MKTMLKAAAIAGLFVVAACNKTSNESSMIDNAGDNAEAQADNLQEQGNIAGSEMMENKADALDNAQMNASDHDGVNSAAAVNAM